MIHPLREMHLDRLERVILKPFLFNDMKVTVVNAMWAYHPAGWAVPEHSHLCFEFSYVTEGVLAMVTAPENGEKERECLTTAGQASVVPPHVKHKNHSVSEVDYGYCIRFSLEKLPVNDEHTVFSMHDHFVRHLHARKDTAFDFDGERHLENFFRAGDMGVQWAVLEFLTDLCGCGEEALCVDVGTEILLPDVDGQRKKDRILVEQALFYLNSYREPQFNVEMMAKSLYVSYRQLARVFKNVTGKSLLKYYNDIRISRAKKLLENSSLSIKQVALDAGFGSEYYLFSLFKKSMNMTPCEYRSMANKDFRVDDKVFGA